MDRLVLNPASPNEVKEVSFGIVFRNHLLNLRLTSDRLEVSSQQCSLPPIKLGFGGGVVELEQGQTIEIDLRSI